VLNRESFLFKQDADLAIKILVPQHASRAEIHRDEEGYWINVWWNCGIIAPLTIQEMEQANENFRFDYDPADYDVRRYSPG
jgi:hypothetical protein